MDNFVKNTLHNTDFNEYKRKKDATDFDSFKYSKFSPFRKDESQSNEIHNRYPKPPMINKSRTPPNPRRMSSRERIQLQQRLVCNNCGIQGHLNIDCKQPIQSYGLLILDNTLTKVLVIQRKDSFGYMSLINNENLPISSVASAAKDMTIEEQEKIIHFDFDSLWKDVVNDQRLQKNRKAIEDNQSRFNSYQIKSIVSQLSKDALRTDTEWGFPKGRIKKREKWLECAKRETCEEIGVPESNIEIISDMPFMENIKGFDERMYINIYYVAKLNNITELFIPQRNEVKFIKWIDLSESDMFFEHNTISMSSFKTKKKLLRQLRHFIESYNYELNFDSSCSRNISPLRSESQSSQSQSPMDDEDHILTL